MEYAHFHRQRLRLSAQLAARAPMMVATKIFLKIIIIVILEIAVISEDQQQFTDLLSWESMWVQIIWMLWV